jgi:RP/EB family microtubule-associated protein
MKKSVSNTSVSKTATGAVRTTGSIANRAAPAAGVSNSSLNVAQFEREKAELESEYQKMLSDMTQQTMDLKMTVEQVEKEREFYFSKLREIEIFIQSQVESGFALAQDEAFKQIQVGPWHFVCCF